jgi:hypothetical protein
MSIAAKSGAERSLPRPRPQRVGRTARQRSIRSTITIPLVIPLLSLIALWSSAAVSTVGAPSPTGTTTRSDRQRLLTNAAINEFRVAAAKAAGLQPAGNRPAAATLLADLAGVAQLRA